MMIKNISPRSKIDTSLSLKSWNTIHPKITSKTKATTRLINPL